MPDQRRSILPASLAILLYLLLDGMLRWMSDNVLLSAGSMTFKTLTHFSVNLLAGSSYHFATMCIALVGGIWTFRTTVNASAVCELVAIVFGSFAVLVTLVFLMLQISGLGLIEVAGNFLGLALACAVVKRRFEIRQRAP